MLVKSQIIKLSILALTIGILIYTRFIGIDWGLPYPMHPDERNMAIAILGMNCHEGISITCLSPDFYAYGQFTLFIGYLISIVVTYINGSVDLQFSTVILALRTVSALSSIISLIFIAKSVPLVSKSFSSKLIVYAIIIFTPVYIQFAHFGTTESLLILFVSIMIYLSVKLLNGNISDLKYSALIAFVLGLAIGTKISSILFIGIPASAYFLCYLEKKNSRNFISLFFILVKILSIASLISIIVSPYNLIDWDAFIHSLNYESSIGFGSYKAFYTRQFEYTIPIVYQFFNIFPYAFGLPMYVVICLGLIFLPWTKKYNFFRLIFVFLFIPNAILYSKWSRFYAPVYPILTIIGLAFLSKLFYFWKNATNKVANTILQSIKVITVVYICIYGAAYLSIYKLPDVRFVASKWIYENIRNHSIILSETANVVDIPMANPLVDTQLVYEKQINPISFNFYDVDNSSLGIENLKFTLQYADYIFVPSRRIFWNHTCTSSQLIKNSIVPSIAIDHHQNRCDLLKRDYPTLNKYYFDLFNQKFGYRKVAEFSSYPHIKIFNRMILGFSDESAEETWTVFDHPVIRIYQRI